MENREKVIERILKIFELSKNNPNAAEATAAAAKAQALLAQYHISMSDLDDLQGHDGDGEEIVEEVYYCGKGNKWKYRLAIIVARNFRSKVYRTGTEKLVFYGFTTDTIAARNTFEFLFRTGNLLAQREYTKARREGASTYYLKNTYLDGFMKGVSSVLDAQCTALMIVIPREVEDAYQTHSVGFKTTKTRLSTTNNKTVWDRGYNNGREAMGARSLA